MTSHEARLQAVTLLLHLFTELDMLVSSGMMSQPVRLPKWRDEIGTILDILADPASGAPPAALGTYKERISTPDYPVGGYKLIAHHSAEILSERVTAALGDGWLLSDCTFTTEDNQFAQAMIRGK